MEMTTMTTNGTRDAGTTGAMIEIKKEMTGERDQGNEVIPKEKTANATVIVAGKKPKAAATQMREVGVIRLLRVTMKTVLDLSVLRCRIAPGLLVMNAVVNNAMG
jgi:hypothetical protein